jgi:AcrR family transcriptional regulator
MKRSLDSVSDVSRGLLLRADARRNRERILDVARQVFAADGVDTPVDVVAQEAGVGIATVFRHYPTKDALLAAVIERSFDELTAAAEAAGDSADAGTAFESFLRHIAAVMARDRVLVAVARARAADRRHYRPEEARLFDAVDRLIAAAQAAGAVRPGITAEDISALLSGIGDAANQRGVPTPEGFERYVSVVLDGLGPPSPKGKGKR